MIILLSLHISEKFEEGHEGGFICRNFQPHVPSHITCSLGMFLLIRSRRPNPGVCFPSYALWSHMFFAHTAKTPNLETMFLLIWLRRADSHRRYAFVYAIITFGLKGITTCSSSYHQNLQSRG